MAGTVSGAQPTTGATRVVPPLGVEAELQAQLRVARVGTAITAKGTPADPIDLVMRALRGNGADVAATPVMPAQRAPVQGLTTALAASAGDASAKSRGVIGATLARLLERMQQGAAEPR